jgi:enamine deaminase RidA (YjgF/YER057c/UK114 family)
MIRRLDVGPRMSQAVIQAGTIYLAGQVADDPVPCVKSQTQQILAKIDRLLREAGSDKSKILAATIWLADIQRFDEMNEVWEAWVAPGDPPARATVQAALARPANLVEIMVIAVAD